MKKHELPLIAEFDLDIDLDKLKEASDAIAHKYIDVVKANPGLCMNHEKLVKSVYDNFEQINLTTPSEILPPTLSIKERLKFCDDLFTLRFFISFLFIFNDFSS